jgi:hypothetical protein
MPVVRYATTNFFFDLTGLWLAAATRWSSLRRPLWRRSVLSLRAATIGFAVDGDNGARRAVVCVHW